MIDTRKASALPLILFNGLSDIDRCIRLDLDAIRDVHTTRSGSKGPLFRRWCR
jgi:hypothetical protein